MDGQYLRINTAEIHGEVYKHVPEKSWWYVKIHFPDLKLYVNSIRVSPSVKYPDKELLVQPPKMPIYTRWITIMEFESGAPLWQLMHDEALRAVERFQHDQLLTPDDLDIDISDIQPP